MSWIRLEDNYSRHPKVKRFARLIGNPLGEAYVLRLWTFASECQPDGDMSGMDDGDIADAVGFTGRPQTLVSALLESGLLDASRAIHDWADYQLAIINKREADRARSQQTRALRSAKSRDGRATVAGESRDGRETVEGPSRATVRYGTERDEEQVPVPPDGSTPAQVALIPEPPPVEKPKKRAAKAVKPPDDPQKRPDADAWTAAYKAGVPEADRVTLTQAFWVQWSATRKVEGIDRMLRSLKAILAMPRDKFPRNASPLVWVTTGFANGITASSSAPIASTGTRGAFPTPGVGSVREQRDYSKPIEPTPVVEWTPEGALQRALLTPDFLGPKRLIVPWGKSLPDGFQIPDGVVVVHGQKPVSTSPLLDGARGVA